MVVTSRFEQLRRNLDGILWICIDLWSSPQAFAFSTTDAAALSNFAFFAVFRVIL